MHNKKLQYRFGAAVFLHFYSINVSPSRDGEETRE